MKFLAPASKFRCELEQFANGADLGCFPDLSKELLSYACACLVEVRLEGEHSRISSFGTVSQTGRVLPAAVSAHLRKKHIDDLMKTPPFLEYANTHWHAKRGQHCTRSLLQHCCTPASLWRMTRAKLLETIYQCGFEQQFASVEQEHRLQVAWQKEASLGRCESGEDFRSLGGPWPHHHFCR